MDTEKCVFTFITGNEQIYLKIEDFNKVIEYLNNFCKGDFYISHGKVRTDFFHQIFSKSNEKIPIKRYKNFLFSKDNEYKEKIRDVISKLDLNLYQTSKPEEIEKIFNKEAIHIPKIKIENFKRNHTINEMMKNKGDEFLIHSNDDELNNFKKVEDNILPSYKIDDSFKLDLIIKLNNSGSPIYTPIKLNKMLQEDKIQFINYNDFTKTLSEVDNKNIKEYTNNDLEKICCFLYKLEMIEIEYIMIPDICGYKILYKNSDSIVNDIDPDKYREFIIDNWSNNKEELKNFPISKSKNIYYHNGFSFPIEKDNMIFTNPYDNSVLPLEIVHSCNCFINGIELNNNPHEKININIPAVFNFYNKDKDNIEIEIDTPVGKKILIEEFCINGDYHHFLENSLHRMWKKGYLLNDYGLGYYDKYNKIPENCIKSPWWFKSNDKKKSKDLIIYLFPKYNYLKFLILDNIIK